MGSNLPPGYREPVCAEPDPVFERLYEMHMQAAADLFDVWLKLKRGCAECKYDLASDRKLKAATDALIKEFEDAGEVLRRDGSPSRCSVLRALETRRRVGQKVLGETA